MGKKIAATERSILNLLPFSNIETFYKQQLLALFTSSSRYSVASREIDAGTAKNPAFVSVICNYFNASNVISLVLTIFNMAGVEMSEGYLLAGEHVRQLSSPDAVSIGVFAIDSA